MHEIISMDIMPSDGIDPKLQVHEEKSYLYHKVWILEDFIQVYSFFDTHGIGYNMHHRAYYKSCLTLILFVGSCIGETGSICYKLDMLLQLPVFFFFFFFFGGGGWTPHFQMVGVCCWELKTWSCHKLLIAQKYALSYLIWTLIAWFRYPLW